MQILATVTITSYIVYSAYYISILKNDIQFKNGFFGPISCSNPGSALCYRSNKLTVAWYSTYHLMVGWFLVFNSTFSNILAISWQPVLVVEEAGIP